MSKTSIVFDASAQVEVSKDICKCKLCKAPNSIEVVPEMKSPRWTCANCLHTQDWKPSTAYQEAFTPKRVTRLALFLGPCFGTGQDGCLTNIHAVPGTTTSIILSGLLIATLVAVAALVYQDFGKPSNNKVS